jgi:hypothetical protein
MKITQAYTPFFQITINATALQQAFIFNLYLGSFYVMISLKSSATF